MSNDNITNTLEASQREHDALFSTNQRSFSSTGGNLAIHFDGGILF